MLYEATTNTRGPACEFADPVIGSGLQVLELAVAPSEYGGLCGGVARLVRKNKDVQENRLLPSNLSAIPSNLILVAPSPKVA